MPSILWLKFLDKGTKKSEEKEVGRPGFRPFRRHLSAEAENKGEQGEDLKINFRCCLG